MSENVKNDALSFDVDAETAKALEALRPSRASVAKIRRELDAATRNAAAAKKRLDAIEPKFKAAKKAFDDAESARLCATRDMIAAVRALGGTVTYEDGAPGASEKPASSGGQGSQGAPGTASPTPKPQPSEARVSGPAQPGVEPAGSALGAA